MICVKHCLLVPLNAVDFFQWLLAAELALQAGGFLEFSRFLVFHRPRIKWVPGHF